MIQDGTKILTGVGEGSLNENHKTKQNPLSANTKPPNESRVLRLINQINARSAPELEWNWGSCEHEHQTLNIPHGKVQKFICHKGLQLNFTSPLMMCVDVSDFLPAEWCNKSNQENSNDLSIYFYKKRLFTRITRFYQYNRLIPLGLQTFLTHCTFKW